MRMHYLLAAILFVIASCAAWGKSQKIFLPPRPGLTRADVYVIPAPAPACATLILCPGHNGNGEEMVDGADWADYAAKRHLNLLGLSFASNDDADGHGYFDAEDGSGAALIDGLRRAFGPRQVPLLLYGFSRGAQFTYTFAHWKPDLVLAWCAYSATEWKSPEVGDQGPRGIVACGDEDEPNYSSAVYQFLRGRSMNMPWTLVSLAHIGHTRSASLDNFVRAYFTSVLLYPHTKGLWLDVDTKRPVSPDELREHPTLAAWLPDDNVAGLWKQLHQP